MRTQRPSEPGTPVSMQSTPQNRWMILALLCVPLVGGVMLFKSSRPASSPPREARPNNPLPVPESNEPLPRVIEFPSGGPSPAGKVSLKDIRFDSAQLGAIVGPFQRLSVLYTTRGELILTEWAKKQPVWRSPDSHAEFVEETVAGVHTVRKVLSDGEHPLWSDRANTAAPDLKLERDREGKSRLLDKKGGVLWAGQLQSSAGQSSRSGPGDVCQIRAGGAVIDGLKGTFTVKDAQSNTLLWSGRLPVHPMLLVRDGHRFTLLSPNFSQGGEDSLRRVRFETEAGTVTITDDKNKTLGTRPIRILKSYQTEELPENPRTHSIPARFVTPNITLMKKGTIFVTYKDSADRVIRRTKVYKDDRSSGATG